MSVIVSRLLMYLCNFLNVCFNGMSNILDSLIFFNHFSSTNPAKTREVHMTMAQLDTISGNMHELCKTTGSGGSSAASQPLDKLLFPHRMSVLQWQWAAKV